MKLPSLPFSKKEKPEYFLSLIFRTDKLEAYVFEKLGQTMRVITSTEDSFSDSLETAGFEEILDVADKVITDAEDEAKLGDEVTKTIFGLKDSWVVDNKIKKENLEILKKLCDSLGLTPIGFLTIPEAIVSLLEKEEGAPPSAILVDVSKNQISVSLVKAGKVIESKTSEIHQSPVFTVDTLLKHFETMEILPSRVILLNEDEELVQEFLNHQWSKSLPFLHLPQTTNIPEGFLGKSFILGVANQFNIQVIDQFQANSEKPIEEESKENTKVEEVKMEEPIIVEEPEYEPEQKIEEVEDAKDFFGFTDKDVAKVEVLKEESFADKREELVTEEIPEEVKMEEEGKHLLPAALMLIFPKAKSIFAKARGKVKTSNVKLPEDFRLPNIPLGGKKLLLFIIPLALLVLLIVYYFLGLRAIVVLSIKPNVIEKTQDIVFSTSSDFKNNIIKGDPVSQDEDGSTTTPATGSKDTGDLAKGTVTLFNSSRTTITLPAQTTITSSNNLNFQTINSVTIASESADVPPTAGSAIVNVKASKFGTEYNLPSGTKFISIVGNPDLAAKNDNPFSGGTKKTLTVVSKDDIAKDETDLEKQLEDKAKSDIQTKLSGGTNILSIFTNENVSKENLDKKVDDEGKSVTLNGTVTYQTISYAKNEFSNYLQSVLGTSVNFENVELSFSNIRIKGGDTTATVDIKAKTFPQIDIADLAKKLGGKSFTFASNTLSSIPQVSSVSIRFSPNIPFLPKFLPRVQKNIIFQILDNG